MKRELLLILATLGILASSATVHAQVLIDTGEPTGELQQSSHAWRGGQVTLDSSFEITGIHQFMQVNRQVDVTVTLRNDDSGLPGTVLFSATATLTPTFDFAWEGANSLSWKAEAGTYWVTMEYYQDPTMSSSFFRKLGFLEDGTAPPNPLSQEALNPYPFEAWFQASGRTGWRIFGTAATPAQLIAELVQDVMNLNLQSGIGNALDSKLQNALDALDRAQAGDTASAVGILYAFIQSVEAQRGKALTDEQADQLVASAQAVIDALNQP